MSSSSSSTPTKDSKSSATKSSPSSSSSSSKHNSSPSPSSSSTSPSSVSPPSTSCQSSSCKSSSCCRFLYKIVIFFFIFYLFGKSIMIFSRPVFSPAVLENIWRETLAQHPYRPSPSNSTEEEDPLAPLLSTLPHLLSSLHSHYPHNIHFQHEPSTLFLSSPSHPWLWLTNLSGGFKTSMLLLHCSLSEYIIIWGSSLGTVGHSGRNWAEFHDFMLSGEGQWSKEGQIGIVKKKRGEYVHTKVLEGGIVKLGEMTYMLEYSRGVIPSMLPFGVSDALFSSLDWWTVSIVLWEYMKIAAHEIVINGKF